MKYLFSKEYGTLYFINEDGNLCGMPMWGNGKFDTDEHFVCELDNDEVPRSYYEQVINTLKG